MRGSAGLADEEEAIFRGAHKGYAKSIHVCRGIEKVFGWIKQFGCLRQVRVRGLGNVRAVFSLHVIAYNLIRLSDLLKPAEALV